jgi:hypothetical protein
MKTFIGSKMQILTRKADFCEWQLYLGIRDYQISQQELILHILQP